MLWFLPIVSGRKYLFPVILAGLLYLPHVGVAAQEAPDNPSRLDLKPRTLTERRIYGGEAQTFEIQLETRQYLKFYIEKGDLNLILAIYDPQGQKIYERTSRDYEALEVSLVAPFTGNFRLEVRSLEQEREPRAFKLTIGQSRAATSLDIQDGKASKFFADASQLRTEWGEPSLRKAIDNYMKAWQTWHSAAYWPNAVTALMDAASVHYVLGEYRQALSLYQRAVTESRRAADKQQEMEAASYIGRLYSNLGHNDKAQSQLQRVVDYLGRLNRTHETQSFKHISGEALDNMGEVSYSEGKLIQANDYLQGALQIFKESGNRSREARASLFSGFVSATLGEHEKASTYFNRALELYRTLKDRHGEMLTLNALGSLKAIKGDAQSGLDMHLETLSVFHTIGDHQSEALTLTGIGQDYDILNNKETALDYYEQALKLFQANGSLDFATVALYQVAGAHRALGKNEKAFTYYDKCIRLSRAVKKSRMEAYALNDVAAIYETQGKKGQTLNQFKKVLRLYRAIGDRLGQALTLNNIGDLYSSLGDRRQALEFYLQAQPLSHQSGDREIEISTLYHLAVAAKDNGKLDDALSYIKQSIEGIELLRSYVASPDLRSSYFASVHKHYELYIDLLMQLERQRPGQGFALAALQVCERARARSLIEILAEANANLRLGISPALLERERALQEKLRLKTEYQLELSAHQTSQTKLDEVEREIRQLIAEYQVVQAQFREQDPRYASLTQAEPLSLVEIQKTLLDQDTILLEYSLGEERSYLWDIRTDSFRIYELPARAELEKAAYEVYNLLTARVPPKGGIDANYQSRIESADRQYFQKAKELSQMLLGPVVEGLGHKRLLILSEGILQYIPFDALPVPGLERDAEEGATKSGSNAPVIPEDTAYLVSSHEIVTLPSISTLVALRKGRAKATRPDKLVAVFADPVFSMNDSRVRNVKDLQVNSVSSNTNSELTQQAFRDFNVIAGDNSFPRLRQTLREAELIRKASPQGTVMVATDFDASREAALRTDLNHYRIVHFATHSLINSEHPELSGIVLSLVNQSGDRREGFLQLSDIYSINLSADLVVLSACNTGLGKNIKGEGLVGLTRGFMYAGSKSVVASLWKVDDQATAELMGLFYHAMLQQGLQPAAALKAAKESLRQKKQWRAPYFWAAFVLQGEFKDPIPVNNHAEGMTKLIISMAVILIFVAIFILIRRRRGLHLQ